MTRIALVMLGLAVAACPAFVWADGGTVRRSEQVGAFRVTVFTSPTPLRAGPVDVSILVQDAAGQPLADADMVVTASHDDSGTTVSCPATRGAATNKLFHAAKFDLPAAGAWTIDVHMGGRSATRFTLEAAEQLPRWAEMWPWIMWPVVPILLFAIHQARAPGGPPARGEGRPLPRRRPRSSAS